MTHETRAPRIWLSPADYYPERVAVEDVPGVDPIEYARDWCCAEEGCVLTKIEPTGKEWRRPIPPDGYWRKCSRSAKHAVRVHTFAVEAEPFYPGEE